MAPRESLSRIVAVSLRKFRDQRTGIVAGKTVRDHDPLRLLFVWFENHYLLSRRFLSHDGGEFAEQQGARSNCLGQPQSDQLDRGFTLTFLLARSALPFIAGRLGQLQVETRAEFAKDINGARKMFRGQFRLRQHVGAARS